MKSLKNVGTYIGTIVVVCILCSYVTIFLLSVLNTQDLRGGIRTTEKTSFGGMIDDTEFCARFGEIDFGGVWLKRTIYGYSRENVTIPLKLSGVNIQVKKDSGISGTLLSVKPTLFSRLFADSWRYNAKEITIWVSTDEEKVKWENWLREVDVAYAKRLELLEQANNSPLPAKKIIPLK